MTQQASNGINLPAVTAGPTTPSAQAYNGPPAGVYEMQATDAELGMTNGGDGKPPAPQVGVLLEFTDGQYKGTSTTWYGFFTDATKASTIRALRTLGWQGDDLSDLSTVRGRAPCTLQVEADLQGVPRLRVRFVGGGSIAMKTTMTDEQKKAFAASMMGFAKGITKTEPSAAPNGSAPPSGQPGPNGKFF